MDWQIAPVHMPLAASRAAVAAASRAPAMRHPLLRRTACSGSGAPSGKSPRRRPEACGATGVPATLEGRSVEVLPKGEG